jgi:Uma2 family endonuclease
MGSETQYPNPDWTVAQLCEHFGGIPAERILRRPMPGRASEEDALFVNERKGRRCELIDGTLIEKSTSANAARIAAVLGYFVLSYLDAHLIGDVTGARGLLPLSSGNLRSPDLAFFLFDSLPDGVIPSDPPYPDIVPDFAVLLVGPSNTRKEIDRKLEDFFRAGTTVMWVIDPRKGTARVHRSATDFDEIGTEGVLSAEPVLPGFSVALDKLLTPRRRPRPEPEA